MHISLLGWTHIVVSMAVAPTFLLAVGFWVRGPSSTAIDWALYALLAVTVLTGFILPAGAFGPAQALGILMTALLAAAAFGRLGGAEATRQSLAFILPLLWAAGIDLLAGVVAAFQFVPALQLYPPSLPQHLRFSDIAGAFRNTPFLIVTLLLCALCLAASAQICIDRLSSRER